MNKGIISTAMVVALMAGSASADVIMSFGFTDLNGSYDGTGFSAVAVDSGALSTTGDVTRLANPGATADFNTGFASGLTAADVSISIDVTNLTATTADGMGSFVITDADGDTIAGDLDGVWTTMGFGSIFFTGLIGNVQLTANANNTFDGPSGGSFDMNLPGEAPYEGAFVQLSIDTSGGFFSSEFTGRSIQVVGEIVPTPGSLALLGAGGLVGIRRRRRN